MKCVILSLLKKEAFNRYYATALKVTRSEPLSDILRALNVIHEKSESDLTIDDLIIGLGTCYPQKKSEGLIQIVESWAGTEYSEELLTTYLEEEYKKSSCYDIALTALEYSEGRGNYDKVLAAVERLDTQPVQQDYEFASDSIRELKEVKISRGGYRWRLKTLNRLLGHLPRGSFGFLFARPDSGKTTFLASEITYMARQMQEGETVLWIANEEPVENVKVRTLQAVFGKTEAEIFAEEDRYQAAYNKHYGGRLKISGDPMLNNRKAIEDAIKRFNVKILVLDQLDKVGGFKQDDRQDLTLGTIYKWARDTATKMDVAVIGVTQAGASAEGKKYLRMVDVMNSNTAKQAEADWILGIGKDTDNENIRYLHTPKDKLPLSDGKDPNMRHGYAEVMILPDIARYQDLEYGA